jgi:hypothetical protein
VLHTRFVAHSMSRLQPVPTPARNAHWCEDELHTRFTAHSKSRLQLVPTPAANAHWCENVLQMPVLHCESSVHDEPTPPRLDARVFVSSSESASVASSFEPLPPDTSAQPGTANKPANAPKTHTNFQFVTVASVRLLLICSRAGSVKRRAVAGDDRRRNSHAPGKHRLLSLSSDHAFQFV